MTFLGRPRIHRRTEKRTARFVSACPQVLPDPEDGRTPTVQPLLVPEVVQLPPRDAAEASDSLEELAVYGFEAEPFGKDSFRINAAISTLAERGDVAGGF